MSGSPSASDMLASMLSAHMQIEAFGLCAAKQNIQHFAAYYLDEDDPPSITALYEAVIEFAILTVRGAVSSHFDMSAGVLGINVDDDSPFYKRAIEETKNSRARLLNIIFNTHKIEDSEVEKYMNGKGPLSRFMAKED